MDVTRRRPSGSRRIFQATKQAFVYAFNRETGEPIWPIEERAVPASKVPGEKLSPTQPFPTKPAPFDLQGRHEDDLIDYTPEMRQQALECAWRSNHFGPLFNPPLHRGQTRQRPRLAVCPETAAASTSTARPSADPVTGIIFVTSRKRLHAHA